MTTPGATWLHEVALGPGVRAAFTSAPRGVAEGFDDDAAAVARNRRDLDGWAGEPVTFVRQVHGAGVHHARTPPRVPAEDAAVDADAVLGDRGTPVGVRVADCVPVLLADPRSGLVAAAHAGRRGVLAGVVGAAVAGLVRAGAVGDRVRAVVGPAICGACYEVPAAVRDEVAAVVPCGATTSWGTPALDLRRGVELQLRAAGVRAVEHLDACTLTDDRWFSHRAVTGGSGVPAGGPARPAGRFAAVVVADR